MEKQEELFRVIVTEFQDKIYRLCWIYVQNDSVCDDLMQDIYVKIWRNLKKFKKQSALGTWIYRVVVNTCIDFIRKKNTNKTVNLDRIDYERIADGEKDVENRIIEYEKMQILQHCIQKLTEIEKAIIALYLEELKYHEIAEIIGISEKNVGVKISRIKNKMKSFLP
jgi:RNA polymerase sigma-70 factor (ECF subfamily)